MILMLTLSICWTSVTSAFLYMLYRNKKVYEYRKGILDGMRYHPGWQKDMDRYQSVSYQEMVYKFWVWPLDRFYEEE